MPFVVTVIVKWNQLVTLGICKLTKRFSDSLGDTPGAIASGTLGANPDDCGEQGRGNLLRGKLYQRFVREKRASLVIRNGAQNTFCPRIPNGNEKDLKDRYFSVCQFGHGSDGSRQWIRVEA